MLQALLVKVRVVPPVLLALQGQELQVLQAQVLLLVMVLLALQVQVVQGLLYLESFALQEEEVVVVQKEICSDKWYPPW